MAFKPALPIELPKVGWRAFLGHGETLARHRQIRSFPDIRDASVTATTDGGMFPVRSDGNFIGQWDSPRFAAVPGPLAVVA